MYERPFKLLHTYMYVDKYINEETTSSQAELRHYESTFQTIKQKL